jgi:glycogen debranching enzyme
MDGDPPFESRGCFAQAWGAAEVLRAWSEINESERQRRAKPDVIATSRGEQRKTKRMSP